MPIDLKKTTAEAPALFHRDCEVVDAKGTVVPLVVTFYAPLKNPDGDEYIAKADVACEFFSTWIYGVGEDAPQAFFALPVVVVSYLIGQRRFGYEAYFFEKGDLDYSDFWLYRE